MGTYPGVLCKDFNNGLLQANSAYAAYDGTLAAIAGPHWRGNSLNWEEQQNGDNALHLTSHQECMPSQKLAEPSQFPSSQNFLGSV